MVGEWTEGVRGDAAVILRDGQPVSISDLLNILNSTERTITAIEQRTLPYAEDESWPLVCGIHREAKALRERIDV